MVTIHPSTASGKAASYQIRLGLSAHATMSVPLHNHRATPAPTPAQLGAHHHHHHHDHLHQHQQPQPQPQPQPPSQLTPQHQQQIQIQIQQRTRKEDAFLLSLPSQDREAWYGAGPFDEDSDDFDDEEDHVHNDGNGLTNRGHKLAPGAKFVRRGRLAGWVNGEIFESKGVFPSNNNNEGGIGVGVSHPLVTRTCQNKRPRRDEFPVMPGLSLVARDGPNRRHPHDFSSDHQQNHPHHPPHHHPPHHPLSSFSSSAASDDHLLHPVRAYLPLPPQSPVEFVLSPLMARTFSSANRVLERLSLSAIDLIEADVPLLRALTRLVDFMNGTSIAGVGGPIGLPFLGGEGESLILPEESGVREEVMIDSGKGKGKGSERVNEEESDSGRGKGEARERMTEQEGIDPSDVIDSHPDQDHDGQAVTANLGDHAATLADQAAPSRQGQANTPSQQQQSHSTPMPMEMEIDPARAGVVVVEAEPTPLSGQQRKRRRSDSMESETEHSARDIDTGTAPADQLQPADLDVDNPIATPVDAAAVSASTTTTEEHHPSTGTAGTGPARPDTAEGERERADNSSDNTNATAVPNGDGDAKTSNGNSNSNKRSRSRSRSHSRSRSDSPEESTSRSGADSPAPDRPPLITTRLPPSVRRIANPHAYIHSLFVSRTDIQVPLVAVAGARTGASLASSANTNMNMNSAGPTPTPSINANAHPAGTGTGTVPKAAHDAPMTDSAEQRSHTDAGDVEGLVRLSPTEQLETVRLCLAELTRFLADSMEYQDRLAEIRDAVLGVERRRKGVWAMARSCE